MTHKRVLTVSLFAGVFLVSGSLFAEDKIKFGINYMHGISARSELQNIYGKTDLIDENVSGAGNTWSMGDKAGSIYLNQFNTKWSGGKTKVFPLYAGFEKSISDTLSLAGSYSSYKVKPKFKHKANSSGALEMMNQIVGMGGKVSAMKSGSKVITKAEESNADTEMGLKVTPAFQSISITPRIGYRLQHFKSSMTGLSAGSTRIDFPAPFPAIQIDANSYDMHTYTGTAKGIYMGLDLTYNVGSTLSLIYSYTNYDRIKGDGKFINTASQSLSMPPFSFSSSGVTIAVSDYHVRGSRHLIGIERHITQNWHILFAYQLENYKVSYPYYKQLVGCYSPAGAYIDSMGNREDPALYPTKDVLSNKWAFEKGSKRDRGSIIIGTSVDIDFSGWF